MARTARSVHARKKRRKVLEQAKGYRGTKHTSYKRAKEQVWKSGVYAYEGRKQRKRDFRALWIQRINAGVREHGLSYSQFIHGLRLAEIDLDRKILADLAATQPDAFAAVVSQARNALNGEPVQRRIEVELQTEPRPEPRRPMPPNTGQVSSTSNSNPSRAPVPRAASWSRTSRRPPKRRARCTPPRPPGARPKSSAWTSPPWRGRDRVAGSPSVTWIKLPGQATSNLRRREPPA